MRIPLAEVAAAGPQMLSRIPYRFQMQVPPLASGDLRALIPGDATVERLVIRFYPGPELQLLVDPHVERRGGGRQELIHYTGTRGITGDNDILEFFLALPVRLDEQLVVFYHNRHATLAYHFTVTMELDFAGGVWRWPYSVGGDTYVRNR